MLSHELLIFTGNGNRALAERICDYLGLPAADATVARFPDGEISIKVNEDVRGADCYIVQPTCHPVNDNLMELLILIDCLRRSSARRITAVIPYFGYARQDRKDEGRVPITAKLCANMITAAGASRILTLDLHAAQIQGFFDIPLDHLYARPIFLKYFSEQPVGDLVVAAPDIGSSRMAWGFCKKLDARLALVEKRRISPNETETQFVIGDVKDKNVIVVDDVISTGGSISNAAKMLKDKGAKEIWLCATHPVLCGDAMARLEKAPIREIVVGDTIPIPGPHPDKLRVLSVAPLLGEAVRRIHSNQSVSSLFL